MCGIIGYIGKRDATPIIVEGLRRLEYRGYDSAGICVAGKKEIDCLKVQGKIKDLEKKVRKASLLRGKLALGHTRWATHGEPSELNAHPHWDCKKEIMVVHNGIVENYRSLKKKLEAEGHKFISETDTEVLAHLIEKYYQGDLKEAVRLALLQVEGTYGIGVLSSLEPDKIIAARMGSPLVVGVGKDEYFIASDVSPLLAHTKKVIYLDDGDMVVLSKKGYQTLDIKNHTIKKKVEEISWTQDQAEKSGFPHFMLKEIFQQPESTRNAMRGRLLLKEATAKLGGLNISEKELDNIKKIIIIACGTSYYAGLIGEYLLEDLARIACEVEYASEFRYRKPVLDKNTLVIAISQSGETADTLAAVKEAKKKKAKTLGIVNVVGSSIAREVLGGVYIHAGPEIGVASTKAFTGQVTTLALLAILLGGRRKTISEERARELTSSLDRIPLQIQNILDQSDKIKEIAKIYKDHKNFLFLGRGYNLPVALEGALKLKEISYIHAEGYPAAEMKHGPIALIDKNMPVVFIATKDDVYNKVMSNIEEVKARGGRVLALATEGDKEIKKKANHVIYLPKTLQALTPLLAVVPLQLLAYYIAVLRGCSVDQPRHLAKSVTVE